MTPETAELVLAVRAVNVFFSLCLVLMGSLTLVLAYAKQAPRARLAQCWLPCEFCEGASGDENCIPTGQCKTIAATGLAFSFIGILVRHI